MAASLRGQRALLIASTDLSHHHDARTASRLDSRVIECVEAFDPEGLLVALRECPEHACGGGPAVSVMMAARALGACDARVLKYGDSGDVSGDNDSVVGYLAAAFGSFGQ
jgi:AmmeMemoRadiSam system protein B